MIYCVKKPWKSCIKNLENKTIVRTPNVLLHEMVPNNYIKVVDFMWFFERVRSNVWTWNETRTFVSESTTVWDSHREGSYWKPTNRNGSAQKDADEHMRNPTSRWEDDQAIIEQRPAPSAEGSQENVGKRSLRVRSTDFCDCETLTSHKRRIDRQFIGFGARSSKHFLYNHPVRRWKLSILSLSLSFRLIPFKF